MQRSHRKLVEDFFTALSAGALTDDLFTDDMTVWTTGSGTSPRQRYQDGVKVLKSLFREGPHYTLDSVTVEDDRAAVEVRAVGMLTNNDEYRNSYAFIFRIRDARIAALAEHSNPLIVREKIMPLMRERMAQESSGGQR